MHWIYILQCNDGVFYVGETKRLYRRFWEHECGNGGLNTSIYIPEKIVAIYSVNRLGKFFIYDTKVINNDYTTNYNNYFDRNGIIENFNTNEDTYGYDNLWVENNIAECLMLNNKSNWEKIRGGKYTRFDVNLSGAGILPVVCCCFYTL
jgi:hypothetical protein